MLLKRKDTPENRAYWEFVEKTAAHGRGRGHRDSRTGGTVSAWQAQDARGDRKDAA
jgi:hypothetical protein